MWRGLLTGELLFLRYAWPCAEDKLRAREIDPDDFARLESIVKDGKSLPDQILLWRCFPKPAGALAVFAKEHQLEVWNPETVAAFWHRHQGSREECAVKWGVIKKLGPIAVMVAYDSGVGRAFNPYRLPLILGYQVYVHCHVIAERG